MRIDMHLVLIYGVPGTGKKTVGQALEKVSGYPLLDNHRVLDIVRQFVPWPSKPSIDLARNFRTDLITAASQTGTKGMITTFAGGSPGAGEVVEQWVKVVEGSGGRTTLVQLTCAYEELVSRIQQPSRTGGYKSVTKDELDAFLKKDYFKGLAGRHAITIDTTALPPEVAAKEIMTQWNTV